MSYSFKGRVNGQVLKMSNTTDRSHGRLKQTSPQSKANSTSLVLIVKGCLGIAFKTFTGAYIVFIDKDEIEWVRVEFAVMLPLKESEAMQMIT